MKSNKDTSSCKERCKIKRYGYKLIVPLLILIVLSLASWLYLHGSYNKPKNPAGEDFSQAISLLNNNKLDDACVAFEKILSYDNRSYDSIANMYIASILVTKGDVKSASEKFLKVGNDDLALPVVRYTAILHAAWILVDTVSYDDISKILQKLIDPSNPMHQAANEILGISAMKCGKIEKARSIFEGIVRDPNLPPGISTRSQIMLANIIASNKETKKQ